MPVANRCSCNNQKCPTLPNVLWGAKSSPDWHFCPRARGSRCIEDNGKVEGLEFRCSKSWWVSKRKSGKNRRACSDIRWWKWGISVMGLFPVMKMSRAHHWFAEWSEGKRCWHRVGNFGGGKIASVQWRSKLETQLGSSLSSEMRTEVRLFGCLFPYSIH